MYSLSKTSVSPETAQELIACHFGADARLRSLDELADGFFNAAYKLTLADGTQCVLKVAPPASVRVLRYERDIMQAEVEVLRLVKEQTEMPVPKVLCYDSSGRIVANQYFIMEFVPGIPYNKLKKQMLPDQQQAVERAAGGYVRQMNEIAGKRFGSVAQPAARGTSWGESFAGMMAGVLADGEDMQVVLPVSYAALSVGLAAHYAALDEVTSPRLVHWDLWDGNIFVDATTQRITGIIDFERALWGDPLMECNFGAFTISPAFLEGYGRPMLETESQRRRRALYNIYLYLIMVIECYYRQYETHDQENWARRKLQNELRKLDVLPAA